MATPNLNSLVRDDRLPDRLRDCLARPPAPTAEAFPEDFFDASPRPAAVLMPLMRRTDGWHLLFIRRAENQNDHHSGQVAFPGGRVERTDASHEAAALREAGEEIGLPPENVELLGRLGEYRSVSNFQITPVVGLVRAEFDPVPEAGEVARVFSIPLHWLANPDHLERRIRRVPEYDIEMDVLFYRPYDSEQVWGVTARLVESLVTRIIEREHRYPHARHRVG